MTAARRDEVNAMSPAPRGRDADPVTGRGRRGSVRTAIVRLALSAAVALAWPGVVPVQAEEPDLVLQATPSPFVGRAHELALLKTLYARATREGSVQLVTVAGEPATLIENDRGCEARITDDHAALFALLLAIGDRRRHRFRPGRLLKDGPEFEAHSPQYARANRSGWIEAQSGLRPQRGQRHLHFRPVPAGNVEAHRVGFTRAGLEVKELSRTRDVRFHAQSHP